MPVKRRGYRLQFVTTGLGIGGAEAQVKLLARSFAERNWRIEIVSMLPPPSSIPELGEAHVPVYSLGMKKGTPNPLAVFQLAGHFRRFRPHVVHCHMVHANFLGRAARLITGVPVLVSTAHSVWEGPRWRDWAYKLTDRLSDVTSNVSQLGLHRYIEKGLISRQHALWLPNGVDFSRYTSHTFDRDAIRQRLGWSGRFVWIAVGNLRTPKDYPTMLEGFRRIAASRNDCLLAIAGCGELETELASLARDLGITHAIRWLGSRPDIPELLAASDAYVISSSWEGTPMALLEAAASALPIVATSVGGNPDVIQHRISGLLVPSAEPESLTQAMEEIMQMHPDQRLRLGLAARARVGQMYRLESIVNKWENIYEQLLQAAYNHKDQSWVTSHIARLLCNWR